MTAVNLIYKLSKKVFGLAIYLGYYFSVSLLCWAIVTPDPDTAFNIIEQSYWINFFNWFGVFSMILLFARGVTVSTRNIVVSWRNNDIQTTMKSLVNWIFCSSIFLLPMIVSRQFVAIHNAYNPWVLIVLTAVFLILITWHYRAANNLVKRRKHGAYAN